MNKKLLLAIIAFIIVVAVGLPYGAFQWNSLAEDYSAEPSDVIEYQGQSYSLFIVDGKLEIWGECTRSTGGCQRIALVDLGTIESGETVYSNGSLNIVLVKISEDRWQLNFYDNGVLIDFRSEVVVDENGAAVELIRN